MNFTFQKIKGRPRYTKIKLKGKVVGQIIEDSEGEFQILLHVKRNPSRKDPCPFKTIIVQHEFGTEEKTREFLKRNFEEILAGHILHPID